MGGNLDILRHKQKKKQGGENNIVSRWPHPEVMPIGGTGLRTRGLEIAREFYRVGLREQQCPTHQRGTESP